MIFENRLTGMVIRLNTTAEDNNMFRVRNGKKTRRERRSSSTIRPQKSISTTGTRRESTDAVRNPVRSPALTIALHRPVTSSNNKVDPGSPAQIYQSPSTPFTEQLTRWSVRFWHRDNLDSRTSNLEISSIHRTPRFKFSQTSSVVNREGI